jgi:4-hydroxybenzoate polyprenyltransferase
MTTRRRLVRSNQWWNHKVPPVIGVAAVAIGQNPGPASGRDFVHLGLVLVSITGIAAFGHLLNDWTDIEADALGGKANALATLAPPERWRLVGAALLLGLVPWLWLPHRAVALAALAVEVALLAAYSVSPVRLKARGWLGALADASYAYAVPFVLVVLLFAPDVPSLTGSAVVVLVGLWGLLGGLRGILWHQVGDVDADRAAGVETVAARMGPTSTEALVASVLLPLELLAAAALVVVVDVAWLPWLVLGFVIWRLLQVTMLWEPPVKVHNLARRSEWVRVVGFEFANELSERWLALAALVALAAGSWWWWVAVAVFVVAFANAARSFLGHDLWLVPDAFERLAFSRGVRRDIRRAAERRAARVAQGPAAVEGRCDRRFVFVVCGPLSHLLTLRTAVHHLRPLTGAEIWVLTDSRRNEQVIDVEGVDRVIDVASPPELDDHQASIWLKTSVHHHLPGGEWCYLDSDIIATVPGVEGVFDQRVGPVAFASDVTIRENSVDRFSPWAMTCECVGHGHQHSCSHLREQLAARFGLDVDGTWLHWNGGVFLFGADSSPFLDLWHERAVASFAWPEWKTRDQGALIATVWTLGLQDLPRISPEFNFIADLGNGDLCLDPDRGWAHHPSGPWYDAKLLHLYTSPLEDPLWDLNADVEAVVMRRTRVRLYRYERGELAARVRTHIARARRVPRRLTPARVHRSVRARLGMDVSHLPIPRLAEPEPQRASERVSR